MAKKIPILPHYDCYCTCFGAVIKYHVRIPERTEFDQFCLENNIGYHDGARTDIVKSYLVVFTENVELFDGFPRKVEILTK